MPVSHGVSKITQRPLKHRILNDHNIFDDTLNLISLDFFSLCHFNRVLPLINL